MSARPARKRDVHAAPATKGVDPRPPAPDDEIEILEVVGVNETEREGDPVPEIAPTPEPAARTGHDSVELEQALEEARRQRDHSHDLYLRARAELENFRRRSEREAVERRDADAAQLIRKILPVIDDLERALQAAGPAGDPLTRGVTLVHQQLLAVLAQAGLAPIDTSGAGFDPNRHEAVEVVRASGRDPGAILEEMRRGYMFKDRLIRAALVRVAGGADEGDGGQEGAGG
jgi:molecular chaperone GrpE